ncbi:MAG: hypothetical protein U5J63_14265 [Fodinibius sp.]|nr:hypothetical protein [Fodinibius sp.]
MRFLSLRTPIVFVLMLVVSVGTLHAQSDSTGLTPMKIAQMEQVNEIALSPSGEKAIYTLRVQADPTEKNEPASYHLYMADLASGNSTAFITSMSVSDIAFRPEHKTITFLGSRSADETTSLYEIPMNGGEARQMLSFPTAIASYSWASDGSHLAFMAADTATIERSSLPYHPEIYEENMKQRRGYVTNVEKEGHTPHQMQVEGSIYQMHWSPNGKRLAHLGGAYPAGGRLLHAPAGKNCQGTTARKCMAPCNTVANWGISAGVRTAVSWR